MYGAGFFYIPGTDTCIKLGGYVRIDTTFNGSTYGQPAWSGDLGQNNRYMDRYDARSRMAITVDTRTATEYGVVRTFGQGDFQFDMLGGGGATVNPALAAAAPTASTTFYSPGGGYVAVEMVFIQFAGFTFGKSASAYATPWHGYPGNNNSYLLGGHDTVTGVNNIQYTAQFGNGVSGTIGLDDPVAFNRTAVLNLFPPSASPISAGANAYAGAFAPDVVGNLRVDQAWGLFQISAAAHLVNASYNILSAGGLPNAFNRTAVLNLAPASGSATGAGANAYGGVHAHDIVGNLRVDQAWGLFQVSAAAHFVNASYNILGAGGAPTALSEISGHPDGKWGASVMAALNIKNIPTGAGDDIKIDASYAHGDTKNVISTSAGSPSFAMFSGTSRAGAYQSIGFGQTADAVYLPVIFGGTGDIKLVDSYGVRGAFNHNWDPYWSTSLWGSYSAVRYGGSATDITTAKGQWCASYNAVGKAFSADYTCNPDYNVAQLGVVTRWTPVKNLTFSAELGGFFLDQMFTGAAILIPSAPKPVAVYEYKDQATAYLNVRVQRNF